MEKKKKVARVGNKSLFPSIPGENVWNLVDVVRVELGDVLPPNRLPGPAVVLEPLEAFRSTVPL